MTLKEELKIGDLPILITKRKNQKNLYIRINPPEGDVTISSPLGLSSEDIRLYVLKRLPDINKVRDKMIAQERQSKREYVSGESHYLWGKPYRLQVIYEGKRHTIEKTPTKIIMTVPEGTSLQTREKYFNEWYRKELKSVLDSVAVQCETKTGIYPKEYRIKNMRTRWGTCNIDKRRIWINLQLAKKPPECLEYVVIHELVHLIEKNHTNRFYELVEEFCPTWKEARRILDTMPLEHLESGVDF